MEEPTGAHFNGRAFRLAKFLGIYFGPEAAFSRRQWAPQHSLLHSCQREPGSLTLYPGPIAVLRSGWSEDRSEVPHLPGSDPGRTEGGTHAPCVRIRAP